MQNAKATGITRQLTAGALVFLIVVLIALAGCAGNPYKGTTWYCEPTKANGDIEAITFTDDTHLAVKAGTKAEYTVEYKIDGDRINWIYEPFSLSNSYVIGKTDGVDTLTSNYDGSVYYQDRSVVERNIAEREAAEEAEKQRKKDEEQQRLAEEFSSHLKDGVWTASYRHLVDDALSLKWSGASDDDVSCYDILEIENGTVCISCPSNSTKEANSIGQLERDKKYAFEIQGDYGKRSVGTLSGSFSATTANLVFEDGTKAEFAVGEDDNGVDFIRVGADLYTYTG